VKKSGAKGLANGLGKGAVGLVSKSGAGMFGIFAYSAQGIAKSLRAATYTRSRKSIEAERAFEGQWLVLRQQMDQHEVDTLVEEFDVMEVGKLAKGGMKAKRMDRGQKTTKPRTVVTEQCQKLF
jgi:hypothetical protein